MVEPCRDCAYLRKLQRDLDNHSDSVRSSVLAVHQTVHRHQIQISTLQRLEVLDQHLHRPTPLALHFQLHRCLHPIRVSHHRRRLQFLVRHQDGLRNNLQVQERMPLSRRYFVPKALLLGCDRC